MELRIQRPDGTTALAEGSATPVLAEDGTRLGAVLTLRDVTARRELERQKDEFFANVSHDLRTPLAAIKASIGVVLANEPPELAGAAAPHARQHRPRRPTAWPTLVDDLLELARLQAGRAAARDRPAATCGRWPSERPRTDRAARRSGAASGWSSTCRTRPSRRRSTPSGSSGRC